MGCNVARGYHVKMGGRPMDRRGPGQLVSRRAVAAIGCARLHAQGEISCRADRSFRVDDLIESMIAGVPTIRP